MAGEVATLAADMTPYVTMALSAYGGTVLAKVRDDTADATVGLGRRLLQRIFGRKRDGEPLPVVLADVIENPSDADYLGTLRSTIRKALETSPAMLAEVREILAEARPNVTSNQSGQADRGGIVQNITAGRDAIAVAKGDMTIHRTAD
jgi:hypothetical protein